MHMRSLSIVLVLAATGCAAEPEESAEASAESLVSGDGSTDDSSFVKSAEELRAAFGVDVTFKDCIETVGIGLAPTAEVRPRVPARYALASAPGAPVTPAAIRTAKCKKVNVNGLDVGAHEIAQVGALIASPDGTGNVNNYQLWYYTDSFVLALAMNLLGVPAQFRPGLRYAFNACGAGVSCPIAVTTGPFGQPPFKLSGTAVEGPGDQTLPFSINWFYDTPGGAVKMTSSGPDGVVVANFGGGSFTVATPAGSSLATVFGATTIAFPLSQRFNTYPLNIVTMRRQ